MNDHFIRIAHMLGPLVLTGNRASDIAHAMKLRRLFSALSIDTVIDVGANQGQFRNFLRNRVGFKGQIISFEPVPELAEALKAKAASDGRWLVHPFALGAMSGQATINVMAHTEFSSIRNPIRSTSEDMDRKNTVTRTVSVPIKTLDSVFPENQDFSHTYLKLDTQGFDLEVLRGGNRTVSKIRALQTEVSFQPIYEEMPGHMESILEFQRHGFAVADFFIVSEDEAHRALEFDCVMVRS